MQDHSSADPDRPLVYIRLRPVWTYIDGIRDFTGFFCDHTFSEPKLAQRARVVMQETLENAIKYSLRGPESELEVAIHSTGDSLQISVSSTPDPQHLERLRSELTTMADKEPKQAYLDAFARAATSPEASAQLGLARICFEGEAELRLEEQENGRIRLTATGAI
ncbi:MAG: ATP-binding protein [Myxococcales bacterium]|nr:ATP-binding protein [Myxococcales bacterium]